MEFEKLLVITRKTRLEELIERYNSKRQAEFYIESSGGNFSHYVAEHEKYQEALLSVRNQASQTELKVQFLNRTLLPSTKINDDEVVVTLGQDGLVANTAKYTGQQPIIALNPDPERFDGILIPFHYSQLQDSLKRVLAGVEDRKQITLAKVKLNDGQELVAFNDFFIGCRTHVSARYSIEHDGKSENQSSSGIIVSTGAGSTGWMSSIFNMASQIASFQDGYLEPPTPMSWDERRLLFAVREPFKSRHSDIDLTIGNITPSNELYIESQMPVGGRIFSDGVESDYLEFNSGRKATIGFAEHQAHLVI